MKFPVSVDLMSAPFAKVLVHVKFTNGKVISVLEGGYDLNALADSAFNHVNALEENN